MYVTLFIIHFFFIYQDLAQAIVKNLGTSFSSLDVDVSKYLYSLVSFSFCNLLSLFKTKHFLNVKYLIFRMHVKSSVIIKMNQEFYLKSSLEDMGTDV